MWVADRVRAHFWSHVTLVGDFASLQALFSQTADLACSDFDEDKMPSALYADRGQGEGLGECEQLMQFGEVPTLLGFQDSLTLHLARYAADVHTDAYASPDMESRYVAHTACMPFAKAFR